MQIIVEPGGAVRCLYDEAIDLAALGAVTIRRASHVEPDAAAPGLAGDRWWSDLSPVGGPRLGPFPCRSVALDAERRWLEDHLSTEDVSHAHP